MVELIPTISKDFTFEASHRLLNLPEGHKCANLHGHSYKLTVSLTGDTDTSGFVLDYNSLGEIVQPIVDGLDHSVLVSWLDTELLRTALSMKTRISAMPCSNTSCELMAQAILYSIVCNIRNYNQRNQTSYVFSVGVSLSETGKTSCSVVCEDVNQYISECVDTEYYDHIMFIDARRNVFHAPNLNNECEFTQYVLNNVRRDCDKSAESAKDEVKEEHKDSNSNEGSEESECSNSDRLTNILHEAIQQVYEHRKKECDYESGFKLISEALNEAVRELEQELQEIGTRKNTKRTGRVISFRL